MTSMANAVAGVNIAGLAGLAMQMMAMEAKIALLSDDDPGGAGVRTFVDINAPAGGDGSAVKPFNTLDAAVDAINLSGASQATATGTAPELAATMRPARLYLAPGLYTQSKPFTSPTIVIPSPGTVVASLTWAPPAHNSVSTTVPWTGGVIVESLDGGDPVAIGDLIYITVAPTAGSWAHTLVVGGSVAWRPGSVGGVTSVGDITTSGPTAVAVLIDQATTLDVLLATGQVTARTSELQSLTVTVGGATLNDVFVPGLVTTSLGTIAENSDLTGGVTGDIEAFSSTIAGAIIGDAEFHATDLRGVTALTGDVTFIDTTGWGQLVDAGVTPTGTTTLFGTAGGVVAAGASPQVITFGVTFPTAPAGVSVTPQAAAIDATTFVGITAKSTTTVTIAHGGAGAAAPTFFHWVATLG